MLCDRRLECRHGNLIARDYKPAGGQSVFGLERTWRHVTRQRLALGALVNWRGMDGAPVTPVFLVSRRSANTYCEPWLCESAASRIPLAASLPFHPSFNRAPLCGLVDKDHIILPPGSSVHQLRFITTPGSLTARLSAFCVANRPPISSLRLKDAETAQSPSRVCAVKVPHDSWHTSYQSTPPRVV